MFNKWEGIHLSNFMFLSTTLVGSGYLLCFPVEHNTTQVSKFNHLSENLDELGSSERKIMTK